MKEKTLLKIALISSILGIVVLFFVSENISLQNMDISKINEGESGETVKIIGRIEKLSDTGKVLYIDIGQQKIEKVSVMLFKSSDIALKEGDYVEIIGDINDYKGERTVIANKVRIV
jgi:DNA/RNA endonuclease YhcR with UshA esterase domain